MDLTTVACDAAAMEPRISLITFGVADLERSFHFYAHGLGFPTTRRPSDGIVFFQTHGTTLALFPYADLAQDIGPGWNVPLTRFTGITLAQNVRERHEVNELLAQAVAAGAELVKAGSDAEWGGYQGYFADPDGYLWEVAWGAFEFNTDGSLNVT